MSKHSNQKLEEKLMASTGASANAVSKVVAGLKELEASEVDALLERAKPMKVAEKKQFRVSESEEGSESDGS